MLDEDKVTALAEKAGGAAYIFDEDAFVQNYRALTGAFCALYPRYRLSYSYKTNYTPYICRLVKEQGGYAEVVSDMEYELARRLGYGNDEIVYNGPAKGAALDEHVLAGGICNVDNFTEAARISRIAELNPERELKIGLRINIDLGRGMNSRFGMSPDEPGFNEMLSMLEDQKNVHITGLHCHLSHARDIAAWEKRVEIMLAAAESFIDGVPEYISLGSGMFGVMETELAATFPQPIPDYAQYAAATAGRIAQHYAAVPEGIRPLLFTEPGTTLVSGYVSLATHIVDINTMHGKTYAVTDASFYNLGEITKKRNLPMRVIHNGAGDTVENADIVGYTCLEQDVLWRGYTGTLGVGDLLLFGNVGGYSIVSKPQFIRPNCPMYTLRADGGMQEIMRAETFEDIFDKFAF